MVDFSIPSGLKDVRERVTAFVRDEVLPVESDASLDSIEEVLEPLREKARAAGLWNPHLPAEYGGLGLDPLGMALVHQECGVSPLASLGLNCMAPDEGTMHLLSSSGRRSSGSGISDRSPRAGSVRASP